MTYAAIKTHQVPPNTLAPNRVLRGRASLRHLSGTGAYTLRVDFGGTTVLQFVASADLVQAVEFAISLDGSTNQRAYGRRNADAWVTGSATEDETAAQDLELLVEKSVGGDSIGCDQFTLELAST